MADAKDPSDQDLVRASLGDAKAYASVVRRYESALQRYVSRLLGHGGQGSEDVLQETFLKAYVNLNDYDPTRPFGAWIYRIAHNEAMTHLRRRRSGPVVISGEDGERLMQSVADDGDLQHSIDAERRRQKLAAALATLEPRYRDVMVLRFLEERSYEEISEILSQPMGTVATLVSRGKDRLRRAVAAAGLEQ